MVLATVVQASIMKIYRKYVSSHAEAEYFAACVRFVHGYVCGGGGGFVCVCVCIVVYVCVVVVLVCV